MRERLLSTDVRGWADAWTRDGDDRYRAALGEIKVPTLCLVGEFDKSSPPPVGAKIADAIPGARFAVIPGAPHMPFIEQPAETARVVGDFLRAALCRYHPPERGGAPEVISGWGSARKR